MTSKFKNYFCYKSTQISPVENKKDPIFNLINDYDSVKEILNNKDKKLFLFLYFNKEKIHKILYDIEEVIKINDDLYSLLLNNNIGELFYLDMLLLDNPDSVNYSYSIKMIRTLNNLKNNFGKLKKVILSKIILILIYNFKDLEEYNEEENLNELNEIENENTDIIKDNIEIFKEFNCNYGFNDIINSKIDKIYMNIIICLIKLNKFNDYNYNEEILIQLNLESVYITNTIFKGLSQELNVEKNEFLNEYMINDLNDLKNEKLINFYYFIIVKVLKNQIYINKIDFLEKNRKKLINLVKNNKNKIINLKLSLDLKNKIKSILKTICNDYFYEKYINVQIPEKKNEESFIIVDSQYNPNDIDKSEINNYSKPHGNDELKEEKKLTEGFLIEEKEEPNETEDIEKKTKCKYEIAEQLINYTVIKISIVQKENGGPRIKSEKFFYGKDKNQIEIQRKDLCENANYDELTEEDKKNKDALILYKNYKRYLLFIKEVEECINNSEIKFNPRIELRLEKQGDNTINANTDHKDYYDVLCTSIFINQLDNNSVNEYIDRNIFIYGIEGKCCGFSYLVNELSNEDYENETFKYDDDE